MNRVIEVQESPRILPRASDLVADRIADLGVEVLFGLPGAAIAPLDNAVLQHPALRAVTMRHEGNAMFAAIGYARISGKPGFVAVTSGPGILNCMTGLASAYCDGVPVIVLAGEAARSLQGRGALQDGGINRLAIIHMTRHLSKWSAEVPTADCAASMIARAVQVATTPPTGPVVLTLPVDILAQPANPVAITVPSSIATNLAPESMKTVAEIMARSHSGAILVGSGARHGEAPRWLVEIAERSHWPVITTPRGKGVFPETHPLSLGVFGMGGHRSASRYLDAGVETLLVIGTSLGELTTSGWSDSLRPLDTLIHVDIDISTVARNYPTDLAIAAPAETFLRALCSQLPDFPATLRPTPRGIEREASPWPTGNGPGGRICPEQALREIQDCLPDDTIYTIDSGEHTVFATHHLTIRHPDGYIASLGLGSMGASISAIGARLADPDRTVAAICGDGGFAMIAPELSVACQHGVAIAVFVFNNGRLGMVERGHQRVFGQVPDYGTRPMDVAALARATGADVATVRRAGELARLDIPSRLKNRPLVVDIHVDQSTVPSDDRRSARLSGFMQATSPSTPAHGR